MSVSVDAGCACAGLFGTWVYKFFGTWVGGCVYFLCVRMWSRYSVKRMKNGQEYCSVLRVQFSMNQKQLSWLLFHMLPSARKWDFFSEFLQVKPLQNGIKWGIFFPIECWSVGGFGADSLETEESWVLETAGGSTMLSQPQSPCGPLARLNHDCL